MEYTHTFEIHIDTHKIDGEIEFNTDGKMSYKLDDPFEGFDIQKTARFNEFLKALESMVDTFGEIEKIEVVKK